MYSAMTQYRVIVFIIVGYNTVVVIVVVILLISICII